MKQVLSFVFLYTVLVLTEAEEPTHGILKHGPITPKLTLVATVEGKAFFVDSSFDRTRDEASTYCESLGMRLAEITSKAQFTALDKAVVDQWIQVGATWTGGIEALGNERVPLQNNNPNVACSDIPYEHRLGEDFVLFWKRQSSFLSNGLSYEPCGSVLCETIQSGK